MNTKCLKNRTAKCALTIFVLLIWAPLAQAKHHLAQESHGISGTWHVKMNFSNDRQATAWLAVQKTRADAFAAKWIDSGGITDLDNVTFKNNNLAFVRTFSFRNRDGEQQTFEMHCSFSLKGNNLTGTITTSRGETAASASRYKPSSSPVG